MGLDIFTMATANAHTDEVAESFATGFAGSSQNADGSINVSYNDGHTYVTPIIVGPQGPAGPQGPQGPRGADGSGATYDDTEIRGLISALDTKVDNLFDMVDDINYITAETYATMTDPTTLEDGVYICLVKQDENYPKEGTECYSTLYICIVDDTPTWEFVGKLNVSEKTMESLITSGIATALTNYYTKSEVDALISGGGSEIYTTTETEIGTFLGKKLYRKVVEVESLPNATTLSVPLGVSVDLPVACYGYAFASGSKFSIPYKNNVYLYIESSTNSLEIVTSSNRTSASAKIVVEYTKTTD